MVAVTLNNLTSLANQTSAITSVNANNAAITSGFTDCLSINDTSSNTMNVDLNMNSNNLINLPFPASNTEPVRLEDFAGLLSASGLPSNTALTFASPTGHVGTNVGVGSATTAMRSDAAPPIDQTMSPTWTGTHTFTHNLVTPGITASGNSTIAGTLSTGALTASGETDTGNLSVGGNLSVTGSTNLSSWISCASGIGLNVVAFGADPSGGSDSTTAIQSAINALAPSGGNIIFPNGTYKISSTINIGNGTSSAYSTTYGVNLIGMGSPLNPPSYSGFPTTPSVKLNWTGGSSVMIQIQGPLIGWGIRNIFLEGNSSATVGLDVLSGQQGIVESLMVHNCTSIAINLRTYTTAGYTGGAIDTNSMYNQFRNINILGGSAKGIQLTGNAANDTTANSCYNTFYGIVVNTTSNCIVFQGCDSNGFYHVQTFGTVGVLFDYSTVAGVWPAGNIVDFIDWGSGANRASNSGAPASTATRPNIIRNVNESNGATYPTNLLGVHTTLPMVVPCVTNTNLTNQTAAITATTLFTPYLTGLYRVNMFLGVTTAGNAVNVVGSIQFNDGDGGQSQSTPNLVMNTTGIPVAAAFVNWVVSGNPITFSTTVSGAIGAGVYRLHMSVERLL